MHRHSMIKILLTLCVCFCTVLNAHAAPAKKIRIAYAEGGYFADYPLILKGITSGLQQFGYIENGFVPIPQKGHVAKQMWQWLHEYAGGDKIEFVEDACYSADWDEQKRQEIKETLIKRVREKGDIDMIVTVGTWAGQDFGRADLNIPVVVTSVTNPIEAGIALSPQDSGKDNLAATVQLDRYKRQILLFHSIFKFKKLGIAYEDTEEGRNMISLAEIESAAKETGTELVTCTGDLYISDLQKASENLKICHEQFVRQGVDAVYLTLNNGLSAKYAKNVLAPLSNAHIPTFSQSGQEDVKHGALLSISQLNLEQEGLFAAEQIKAIAEGKKPREVNQIFESIISLTLNLKTATIIGWNPPLELLIAIDEFYQDIQ